MPNSITHPPVDHKLKMHSKKLLRRMYGTTTGWRNLVNETLKEMDKKNEQRQHEEVTD